MTLNPIKKITYYTPREHNDPIGTSWILQKLGKELWLLFGKEDRIDVVNCTDAKLVVEFKGWRKFSYNLREEYNLKHELIDHVLLWTDDPNLQAELALWKYGL